MFEFVPLLKGLYLTYSEYFAALIALVALVLFIVFYLIGKLLYHFAKTTKTVQVSPFKVVKIQSFRDVTRAFGAIFTLLATFFLLVSITSLGAFRVIPIWISALLNFIILFICFLHTIVKLTTREDFGLRRGYYHFRTSPHKNIYNIVLIKLFLVAISVPIFFKGTCICLYEEHYDLALSFDKLGLPASVNTELTRLFLIKNIFSDPEQPGHVYATLTDETSTQVFFNVQTHKSLTSPLTLSWTDGLTKGAVRSTPFTFDDLENRGQRVLHTFLLNQLKPNTVYDFTFVLGSTSHTYKYRTLKKQYTNTDPITIVSGGDVGTSKTAGFIWQQIPLSNPDVIFIGGDLAYDNNNVDCYWTWDLFLSDIEQVSQNVGRIVPIILAIGNHDAGLNPFSERSLPVSDNLALPIFFSFFPQHLNHQQKVPRISERKPYFYQKLGQSIYFTLDSGYLTSYEEQASFIEQVLKLHPFTLHKFAQYHHPIYSSCEIKDYEVINYENGLAHWIPVFDKYNFTTVYENHQHLHKRTQQLKNNLPHKQGTIYLGDGVWGADVNSCALNTNFQYFDNIQRVTTVWVTQLTPSSVSHKAIGVNGIIFDSVTI